MTLNTFCRVCDKPIRVSSRLHASGFARTRMCGRCFEKYMKGEL